MLGCGRHCRRFHPTWEQVSAEVSARREAGTMDARLAVVDCVDETALRDKHHVRKYPTVLLFRRSQRLKVRIPHLGTPTVGFACLEPP